MKDFYRALSLATRRRWTFAAAASCALGVALLWGANIGAVYPFVEVIMNNRSLQTWVRDEVDEGRELVQEFEAQIAAGEAEIAAEPDRRREIEPELGDLRRRLHSEQNKLAWRSWLQPYLEAYLPDDAFATLVLVIAALIVGTFVKGVLLVSESVLVDRLTQLAMHDLRNEFYRRTLRRDLADFTDHNTNDLTARFTHDLSSVGYGIQTVLGKAIREPLKGIVCLIGAAWICPRLLLLSILIAPAAWLLIRGLSKSLKKANRKAMEEMSQLYNALDETFRGIKLVKAFTMERVERRRFHLIGKAFFKKSMRIAGYNALVRPTTELMGIFMIAMAIVGGAHLILHQETHIFFIRMSDRPLQIPEVLLFFGLLAGVSDPARKLSEIVALIQRAAAASERVYQALDQEPQIVDAPGAIAAGPHQRQIEFNDVHFAYRSGLPVLRGIDLTIPYGETLAIVGGNGCGKSTLAGLVARFYDPTGGGVRIDGVDLRELRLRDVRRQIGLVTQEPFLFNDTVFHNIQYGSPHATAEQVVEAAKQAHAHSFIEKKLEHGYETIVGGGGNKLSGGQRQRIAIARAILRDPRILILDEATSQIDLESEQLIHRVLEQFIRSRTTFIITHRLETLALADRVLVMDAGQVVDCGTHDELYARCETYRRLHQTEFRQSA